MTYKGDATLNKLLQEAHGAYDAAGARAVIKGVLAAPEDKADPKRWISMILPVRTGAAAEQLEALKDEIAKTMQEKDITPDVVTERVKLLRAEMKRQGIDGFIIPRADEFQGEYVPASNERLAFITGFTGSAGSAIVLDTKAAFFTDGRYTLQAKDQVPADIFDVCSTAPDQLPTPTMLPGEWRAKNLPAGAKLGFDPWIHSANEVKHLQDSVTKAGGTLVAVDKNPLDAIWDGRPPAPVSPVTVHGREYSGKTSQEKRMELAETLRAAGADALAITMPEDIMWLLNIRGGDVPCTPFSLCYALLYQDGSVNLYIDGRKLMYSEGNEQKIYGHFGHDVTTNPLGDFSKGLQELGTRKATVWVDPGTAPIKVESILKEAGAAIHSAIDPIQLPKAIKNETEIKGTINAHIRDGAALTRFIATILEQGGPAKHTEITASDLLEKIRSEGDKFRGLSFDTISGAGGNGAIVHYRSTEKTNAPLLSGPVYLLDSGAQYLDGTTDVTRTIAVDTPNTEMKENFTRVLKGHIQVAMAVFPKGTTGDKLDVLARAALKEVGLDYAHGTGHGVGSHLSVHEGPCGISPRSTTVPLEAGMIISNEPGFYKAGEYGIRIENLVLVEDAGNNNLKFRTLTLAPIDRNLIEPSLLTADEVKWLDDYHKQVRDTLKPLIAKVDLKAAEWLEKATAPVGKAPLAYKKKLGNEP